MRMLVLLLSLFLMTATSAEPAVNAVATTFTFNSSEDAKRFSILTNETRCVVCQFQNIAESNAPLAGSLRDKIYQLIKANKTDAEIREYLVKRYGEVILLKPRFNPMTAILWLFPLFALISFGLILGYFYRNRQNTSLLVD